MAALGRFGLAIAGLAFATFFGAIGILILTASFSDAPGWAVWPLRLFVLLIFGAMSAGGLAFAYTALRGDAPPALPVSVLGRCPGCGEPWTTAEACPVCGARAASCEGGWRETPREGVGALLFGGAFGGGIASLGVFIGAYALGGDEKRVLMIAAYVGLGLLLLGVGGAMLFGFAGAIQEKWGARHDREIVFTGEPARGAPTLQARARIGAAGTALQGSSERWIAVEEASVGPPVELSSDRRALAEVVAALHARGEAGLSYVERIEWTVHEPPAPEGLVRTHHATVHVEVSPPRGIVQAVDARDWILATLVDGSLAVAAEQIAASPDLAAALHRFASRLAGTQVDPQVIAVVAQVLAAPPGPGGPYRASS